MVWAFFGILYSLFRTAFAEINHHFRVDGSRLNFWHALFGVLFLLPFLPFVQWGMPTGFYVAALIVGLVLTAAALMQLILSSRQEGRVSAMFVPVEALAAFVLWYMFVPDMETVFLSSASQTALTGLGFVLATLGALLIRRNDAGMKGLMTILPGAAALGGSAVLMKMVALPAMMPHAAFTFAFVVYSVMTILMGVVVLIRKEADHAILETKVVQAGIMTGIFSVSAFICFLYSLAYAPNPAYPVLLLMLVPVWLKIYHVLQKEEDVASPPCAALIVFGLGLLICANL